MSTYSSLKFELILTGDQSGQWGNTTNTNIGTAINEAIAGSIDITFASADLTLTLLDTNATQSARNLRLNLTGTAGGADRTLTLGSGCQISKPYIVNNGLANAVTIKNTTGTGISVPAGKTMWVFNNGTNVVDVVTYLSSVTLGSALPVASGGTGQTTANAALNALLPSQTGNASKYLQTDGTNTSWDAINISTADITGTLGAANGGTGQSSYAVGDLLYASGTTALSKLADVATGNALISGGVTTAPSWGKIGLTTHVSGTLAVGNGGTNLTSYTTGDLVYASGATTLASLADVATGNALISGGVGVAPSYGKIGLTTHVSGTLPIANGGTGTTSSTGTGSVVFSTSPTLVTPALGTPASGDFSTGTFTWPTFNQNTTGYAAGIAGGAANKIAYQSGSNTTTFIDAPTTASTYLSWNGSAFAWATAGGGGGSPGGSNTQVQFNNSGSFGGSSAFTWDGTSLTVSSVKIGRGNSNLAYNIAIGNSLLALTGGSAYNIAIGYLAMQYATTAAYNIALGSGAIFNARDSTNSFNVAIGQDAGGSLNSTKGVGYGNNFIGYQSGGLYTGSYNVTLGHLAGTNMSYYAQTTANDYNIVIGGYAAIAQNYDSNNCTFVGGGAQQGWNASITNATTLGYQATVTGSNQVQLGNSSTTTYVYGTVQNRSDARDKTDIRDTQLGLDFITALRPVDFKWDYRESYVEYVHSTGESGKPTTTEVRHEKDGSRKRNRYHHGLIAQEVKAVLDAKGIDFGGYQDHSIAGGKDVLSIGYDELVGPLVKAIQELTARLEALEARN